jgi:hypothetical protein
MPQPVVYKKATEIGSRTPGASPHGAGSRKPCIVFSGCPLRIDEVFGRRRHREKISIWQVGKLDLLPQESRSYRIPKYSGSSDGETCLTVVWNSNVAERCLNIGWDRGSAPGQPGRPTGQQKIDNKTNHWRRRCRNINCSSIMNSSTHSQASGSRLSTHIGGRRGP